MPARSAVAAACLAAATLLCAAAPAAASPNGRAHFERFGENIRLFIEVTENSMQFFELTLPDGAPPMNGIEPLTPGSCNPTGPRRATCDLAFPAKTGDTTGATIETQGRFPDNAGGELELCLDNQCKDGFRRTIAVTPIDGGTPPPNDQPPPPPSGGQQQGGERCPANPFFPRPCADVVVDLETLPETAAALLIGGTEGIQTRDVAGVVTGIESRSGNSSAALIPLLLRIGNRGPDDTDADASVEQVGGPPSIGFYSIFGFAETFATHVPSDVLDGAGFEPTGRPAYVAEAEHAVITVPGRYEFRAVARPTAQELNPPDNEDRFLADIPVLPRTKPKKPAASPRKPPTFKGTAEGAGGRVEVAVVQQRAGARAAARRRACRWVENRRAKVRVERGTTCDEPTWLKAKGTAKWKLEMKKPLRPGRYVLYSRAIGESGAVEVGLDRKAGNRVAFTVKKKKRRSRR